ncbi:hypothetical protein ACJZ2D_011421 [Fusarium nematophilum]
MLFVQDRGGKFCDCIGIVLGRDDIVVKLLSVNPTNYQDAPTEGIRRILEVATGEALPRGEPINSLHPHGHHHGNQYFAGTQRLQECPSTTKGFGEALKTGQQTQAKLFALDIKNPDVLYESCIEVDERVAIEHDYVMISTLVLPPGASAVTSSEYSSLSLTPMVKMIPRGMSAMADAYLTPVMKSYVENFRKSFLGGLQDTRQTKCQFMQSDDGLVDFRRLSGLRAILSPLAGGLVGYARTTYNHSDKKGVIGFDMGGTSTDVSRYAGTYEHVFETTTAGITIQSPQLDINTVAAGGGSILFWKNGLFSVGPDSAVGFLNIANKAICRSIRTLTEGKGYDVTRHRLAAFGGAGGQHACSLARILGIDEVVIHKYSSILLVNGMALANVIRESLEPSSSVLSAEILPTLQERMDCLRAKAREQLQEQGFTDRKLRHERYLNLRYSGTSTALMIQEPQNGDFAAAFRD